VPPIPVALAAGTRRRGPGSCAAPVCAPRGWGSPGCGGPRPTPPHRPGRAAGGGTAWGLLPAPRGEAFSFALPPRSPLPPDARRQAAAAGAAGGAGAQAQTPAHPPSRPLLFPSPPPWVCAGAGAPSCAEAGLWGGCSTPRAGWPPPQLLPGVGGAGPRSPLGEGAAGGPRSGSGPGGGSSTPARGCPGRTCSGGPPLRARRGGVRAR